MRRNKNILRGRTVSNLWKGLLLAALLLSGLSCSRQEEQGVVARIGSRVVTAEDLRAEAARRQAVGQPVGSKKQLLEDLLTHEALVLRAEKLMDDPAVRYDIEHLLISRLRERELIGRLKSVEVTEEAVLDAYERNIEKFTRPANDRFAVLHLRVEKNADEGKRSEIRARMDAARQQAEQNPLDDGFGALAISCSDDQISRYRGGDIGWIVQNKSTTRMPESVLGTARDLEKGGMSSVIETETGFYLVMKTDSRPSLIAAVEQVRGSLRRQLLAAERSTMEEGYLNNCLTAAGPEVNEKALEEFELPITPEQTDRTPFLSGKLPMAANECSEHR